MKNMKTLLLVSAAAILGLVSCGGDGTSIESGDDATSSVSTATATASSIINNLGSYPFTVGETIDLDEYITVNYSDGSSDQDFSVSCSSAGVTIEDHSVTFTAAGDYTLEIESGDGYRTIRASVTAKTADTMEVIDFLYPILTTPQNFTFRLYQTYDFSSLYYHTTLMVNETYTAIYDETDPDGQNGLFGDSTILAQLSDGNYYWGEFISDDDVEFEPGYDNNADYYYIRMASGIDPLDFDETEDSYIIGGTSVSEAIFESINNIVSSYYSYYGYSSSDVVYGEAEVLGWVSEDELLVLPTFYAPWSETYSYFSDLIVGITAIGDSHNEVIEAAQQDPDYLPEVIYPEEVETIFEKASEEDNYTVEMTILPLDSSYGYLYEFDETHAWGYYSGLTSAISQTNYVTSEGVWSELYSYGESGWNVDYEWGYQTDGGSVYSYATDTENGGYTKSSVADASDAYDVERAALTLVDNIGGLDELNITSTGTYDLDDDDPTLGYYVYYGCEVGDDDGTTKTNTLFGDLWDQFTYYDGLGTALSEAVEFTNGYHALTLYSDYYIYAVYNADNSINYLEIQTLFYLPIGSSYTSNYILFDYVIYDIGSTSITWPTVE